MFCLFHPRIHERLVEDFSKDRFVNRRRSKVYYRILVANDRGIQGAAKGRSGLNEEDDSPEFARTAGRHAATVDLSCENAQPRYQSR